MTPMEGIAIAACAYEIFATATGKAPTISEFCRRRRWAEVLLLGWLIVHFRREGEERFIRRILREDDVWHRCPSRS